MKFIIFSMLLVAIKALSFLEIALEEWDLFKLKFDKKYKTEMEDKFRMKIYLENKRIITQHNTRYEKGLEQYMMGVNLYTDMLHYEFIEKMNGYNRSLSKVNITKEGSYYIPPANVEIPDDIDWRTKGAVTPIKNQMMCGSCWAFSATGALEGQQFRKTGKLVSLSEQNLVDCSSKYGNHGCNGGLMDYAFKYIKQNHGIDTESSYPYEGIDDICRYKPQNKGGDDTGFIDIRSGSEIELKTAVATKGPVSVAIDASQSSFQSYSSGVYYDPNCSSTQLDHGVLVVGYGTTDEGRDYWLVKNSWGKTWGMDGYIKMARNRHNSCGIATAASYPLV